MQLQKVFNLHHARSRLAGMAGTAGKRFFLYDAAVFRLPGMPPFSFDSVTLVNGRTSFDEESAVSLGQFSASGDAGFVTSGQDSFPSSGDRVGATGCGAS